MTECTKDGITFSSQGRQQVVADFRGGDISSDAGVLLLREAERGLGLIERLSAAINDPRDPARITHEQRTLLNQRVLASVRRIVIHLATWCPARALFILAAERLMAVNCTS